MRKYTQKEMEAIIEFYPTCKKKRGELYRIDLRNANLRNANLRDANLRDANLWYANLRNADLRNANLRDADLWHANLRNADLRDANLRNADLRDANLRDANLRDANLRNADLRNADLRNANLRDADLRDADLRDADLRGITMNWQSHNLIATRLWQASDKSDFQQLAVCGIIAQNEQWCWDEMSEFLVSNIDATTKDWTITTMKSWAKDDDDLPEILKEQS